MPETLAQLVRKKYPGAYDDLSDEALESKIDAKYPGTYADIPRSAAPKPEAAPKDDRSTFTMGGLTPALTHRGKVTPGELAKATIGGMGVGAVVGAAPALVGSAVAGARKIAPIAGKVLPWVAGAAGATAGYKKDGVTGAISGGIDGAMFGVLPGLPGKLVKAVRAAAPAAKAAAPAVAAAPKVVSIASAAAKAAPKVDRGRAAAAAHKANVDFAREVAKRQPKVGEKIHILLDDAGNPVKYLTPDQAAAAKRAGQATTWIRNMFK